MGRFRGDQVCRDARFCACFPTSRRKSLEAQFGATPSCCRMFEPSLLSEVRVGCEPPPSPAMRDVHFGFREEAPFTGTYSAGGVVVGW
jgi:hypothetical protein